jgi:DNA-binding NtrC family response regulator
MSISITSQVQPLTPTVLYVDDEEGNRQAFVSAFRRTFRVFTAATLQEAWEVLSRQEVHVVLSDQRMPGSTGTELLRLVRERFPAVKRILVSGYSDLQALVDAINQCGVMRFISKPWDAGSMVSAVQDAMTEIRQEREREAFTAQLEETNKQLEFALRQRLLS